MIDEKDNQMTRAITKYCIGLGPSFETRALIKTKNKQCSPPNQVFTYNQGAAERGSGQTGFMGGGDFGTLVKSHFNTLVSALCTSPILLGNFNLFITFVKVLENKPYCTGEEGIQYPLYNVVYM